MTLKHVLTLALLLTMAAWTVQADSGLRDRERRIELATIHEDTAAASPTYTIERPVSADPGAVWEALHVALGQLGLDLESEDQKRFSLVTRAQRLADEGGLSSIFHVSVKNEFGVCSVRVERHLKYTDAEGNTSDHDWDVQYATRGTMIYELLAEVRTALPSS